MNSAWFSVQTLAGLAAALGFAALCKTNIRRAIVVFTVAGAIPGVQVGGISGDELTQGLMPVELFATVLIGVWILNGGAARQIRKTPFNLPLFLLIPSSLISLFVGFTWYDPAIAVSHMKVAVSLGQLALLLWVIGIYLVVANSVSDIRTIDIIRRAIVVLSLPSLLLLVSLSTWPHLEWSTAFALPASSLCFAEFFYVRSPMRRAGLLLLTIAPVIYGYELGKAFYYAYVLISMGTIAWFQARRIAFAMAGPVFAVYVLFVPVATGSFVPAFLTDAVETEEQQQSLGGSAGRDQLVRDAVGIWSEHPVFGVGPGNNYPYMLHYSMLGTAHNQYMNLLMELGVFGLGLFCWFAWSALSTGLRAWRYAGELTTQIVTLGWLGMFVAMLVGGMFGDFMIPSIRNGGIELLALFYVQWILLGLVVSIRFLERGRYAAAA